MCLAARHPMGGLPAYGLRRRLGRLPARGPPSAGPLALPIDLTEGLGFNAVVSIATIFGVAIPAFLVTAATQGEAGVRDLLDRSLR